MKFRPLFSANFFAHSQSPSVLESCEMIGQQLPQWLSKRPPYCDRHLWIQSVPKIPNGCFTATFTEEVSPLTTPSRSFVECVIGAPYPTFSYCDSLWPTLYLNWFEEHYCCDLQLPLPFCWDLLTNFSPDQTLFVKVCQLTHFGIHCSDFTWKTACPRCANLWSSFVIEEVVKNFDFATVNRFVC